MFDGTPLQEDQTPVDVREREREEGRICTYM